MATKFSQRLWIGLSRSSYFTGFTWSDGSPVSFTNWNSGEPNNANNEYCVEMFATNGKLSISLEFNILI